MLAADDPACLYGAALPWPAVAGGADAPAPAGSSRPKRMAGALVALIGGVPVLYAGVNLKSLVAFSADEGVMRRAVQGLVAHERSRLRREGPSAAGRAKLVVETVNGRDALDAPLADLLLEAGFVRLPNGLRLYVDPF